MRWSTWSPGHSIWLCWNESWSPSLSTQNLCRDLIWKTGVFAGVIKDLDKRASWLRVVLIQD